MINRSDRHDELTPEGVEILADMNSESEKLRQIDLGMTPPATVYEAE